MRVVASFALACAAAPASAFVPAALGRPSRQHRLSATTVEAPETLATGADFDAFARSFSTCPSETEPTVLDCPGLPADFPVGTYYRNGGCRFEADDGTPVAHPFDADGMVCGITFDPKGQRMLFRNRFVETEGYLQDKSTGKMSKRGVFGTMRSGGVLANAFRAAFKNVANTNILHLPGRGGGNGELLALWEADKPHVLDPLTLRNSPGPGEAGVTDLDGLLADGRVMTAHPRYDPDADLWIGYGVRFDPGSNKARVDLYELQGTTFLPTRKGRLSFFKDGPALLHDFLLTKNYMIFNLNKSSVSTKAGLKAILGLGAFADFIELDEDATETSIVLVPRSLFDEINDAGSDIDIDIFDDDRVKVVAAPFHANFHFSNAFEDEDGKVVFETIQSVQKDLMKKPPTADPNAPIVKSREIWDYLYPTTITRYSLDPETEKMSTDVPPRILANRPVEFPAVPRNLSTKKHRYIYPTGSHKEIPLDARGTGPQGGGILKVDAEDPSRNEVYVLEPHQFMSECVFVQKVGKTTGEDAGYLVSILIDGRDQTSDLVVFDVEGEGALERGPVTRVRLPTFIPQGLHGSFAPGVMFDFEQFIN